MNNKDDKGWGKSGSGGSPNGTSRLHWKGSMCQGLGTRCSLREVLTKRCYVLRSG